MSDIKKIQDKPLSGMIGTAPVPQKSLFVYLTANCLFLIFVATYIILRTSKMSSGPEGTAMTVPILIPIALWITSLAGVGFILILIKKCRYCQTGPARRISIALEKIGQGELGWKVTLRNSDRLAPVADSVSAASHQLADKISRLQRETRELCILEDFMLDTIRPDQLRPHTLKALRKLKICTSRLQADVDEFQVSALTGHGRNSTDINPSVEGSSQRTAGFPIRDKVT